MNKRQKEVQKKLLNNEEDVLKRLEENYRRALEEIQEKIKILQADELTQSKIYQLEYQRALEKQVAGILEVLKGNNFQTVHDYLKVCYEDSFIGVLYDLQGQGIPVLFPINQEEAALMTQKTHGDIRLSTRLYDNVDDLKKNVISEVSRGISNGHSWQQTARSLSDYSDISFHRAMTIVRTEGHRVQQQCQMNTLSRAKAAGADVVKQWDSTMDSRTREDHRKLNGQIRELDEYFEINGYKALYPGGFGVAKEDIGCRCCMLQRARWALDIEETKHLGRTDSMTDAQLMPIAEKLSISVDELRKYSGQIIPVKAGSYSDFRRQYDKIWNYQHVEEAEDYGIIKSTVTANGVTVRGLSKHMLERASERNVSAEAINDALQNPLHIGEIKTDGLGRKSQRFIGKSATVNVNPETGTVSTIWKTGQRTVKKYHEE